MISLPRPRTVADVMTTKVHVAGPLTQFKLLVRLIEENRISAVPIVDQEGIPVGVVSESDLLAKERRSDIEAAGNPLHAWRRKLDVAKARGVIASDLMTSPAITAPTTMTVKAAAGLMHDHNVKRLVVVNEAGRIAGIVSRSDLLQVFLRTDEEIRADVADRLLPALLPDDASHVEVDVRCGVVALSGDVWRKSDVGILARMTAELDGVVDVVNQLSYRWDDTTMVAVF